MGEQYNCVILPCLMTLVLPEYFLMPYVSEICFCYRKDIWIAAANNNMYFYGLTLLCYPIDSYT